MKKSIFLGLSVLLFAGCATLIEGQRLNTFRKSFRYKTYRFASEKATNRAVSEYTKTDSDPLDQETAHALLGIVWFIAQKNDYSLIEADLVKATSTNENRILAFGLQSIALSKMGCPELARDHYKKLKASLSSQPNRDSNRAGLENKIMLISLIAASLYQDDLDLTKWGADTLGANSQLDYLSPLLTAIVETKKGNPLKAMERLQALGQNDQFSEPQKRLFLESAEMIKDCPAHEQHGQELVDRLILQWVKGALDAVFSDENQQTILKKIMAFSNQFTKDK